ncbi:MAG: hypothetical protein K2X94_05255 [Amoebophilaceae bacterium]|nr:hypothetical protein [Amoebophilaceae bacterium]MBY0244586.1 hypothetical protein [Sphingobacteriaceae bacterium]
MTKKYTDIELYLLLREKAQLVEKTKFTVLHKTFKTGCSATNDISIFSLLGLLLDLQSLKVSIFYPNLAKTKVNFEDLTSFIVRNLSKLKYTYRKVNGITNQPLINWMIIGSSSFESQFADFIEYLQDDLGISLVLPSTTVAVVDDLNVDFRDFTKKHNAEISLN